MTSQGPYVEFSWMGMIHKGERAGTFDIVIFLPFMFFFSQRVLTNIVPNKQSAHVELQSACFSSNAQAVKHLKAHDWNLSAALDAYYTNDASVLDGSNQDAGTDAFFDNYKSAILPGTINCVMGRSLLSERATVPLIDVLLCHSAMQGLPFSALIDDPSTVIVLLQAYVRGLLTSHTCREQATYRSRSTY
jgi:hypothetical protein